MKLIDKIKQYNEAYRKGEPLISDSEYDALIEQLRHEDPENEWLRQLEPASIPSGRKRKLPIPMKSLNKVKSMVELKNWAASLGLPANTQMVIMPKFDGLSLLVNEETREAYSRGGAENEGQDCTAHYNGSNIRNALSCLSYTYGEFIISRSSWTDYFQDKRSELSGEKFKSPRNTAAGLLNRDEPCKYLKHASFFRYGADSKSLQDFDTFEYLIEYICNTFDQIHLYNKVALADLNENMLADFFKYWNALYPIDGVVVYINDLRLWETIGRHQTTGNPLYAVAYKHPDFTESFETTVNDVTWKVSKSGALKPVVNIEMVDTGDCNMENPTGYNASWICDNNIAKGARVLVTRSGGVIPKILQTLVDAPDSNKTDMWDELTACPHCGAPTAWNESMVELCCTNPNCCGIQLAKAVHFYTICGAENMGEETLAKIYNAGFKTIPEMLNIEYRHLVHIEGFGDGIANIILDNNKKIMQGLDMATLMHASDCFEGIGKIKAQKILDDMTDEVRENFYRRCYIMNEDVSSKTMESFVKGVLPFFKFLTETNIPVLQPVKETINKHGIFEGESICMSGFRDPDLEKWIKSEGGNIVSGVSKKTTLLIVKDKGAASSKISKAQSLGIAIQSIEEFMKSKND